MKKYLISGGNYKYLMEQISQIDLASLPFKVTIVNELVRREYTVDKELALHRQRETKAQEFQEYFDYCEECKRTVREALDEE